MDFLFNTNVQFFFLAYLIGGIPFGLLLAKKFAGVDIKKSGSGNIGATNVLRVLKEKSPKLAKKLSVATLILDVIKGVLVLSIAYFIGLSEATLWGIAILAVVGHCFSLYLGFNGGKGVATGAGVIMFMLPLETLAGLIIWVISIKVIKISSISSLIAIASIIIISLFKNPEMAHAPLIIISAILYYKHIPNIIKLFKGEEKRI